MIKVWIRGRIRVSIRIAVTARVLASARAQSGLDKSEARVWG